MGSATGKSNWKQALTHGQRCLEVLSNGPFSPGALTRSRTSEGVNFPFQPLNAFLALPEGPLELKSFPEVSQTRDEDPHTDGTKNDDKKRKRRLRRLHPPKTPPGREHKPKGDFFCVLHGKKKNEKKDDHPEERRQPLHRFRPPFRVPFLRVNRSEE